MQIPQGGENFGTHFVWITLPIILTLGATQFALFLQNRKERDSKNNRLALLLEQYRLHEHTDDSSQPLNERNIRYPRGFTNGRTR